MTTVNLPVSMRHEGAGIKPVSRCRAPLSTRARFAAAVERAGQNSGFAKSVCQTAMCTHRRSDKRRGHGSIFSVIRIYNDQVTHRAFMAKADDLLVSR